MFLFFFFGLLHFLSLESLDSPQGRKWEKMAGFLYEKRRYVERERGVRFEIMD